MQLCRVSIDHDSLAGQLLRSGAVALHLSGGAGAVGRGAADGSTAGWLGPGSHGPGSGQVSRRRAAAAAGAGRGGAPPPRGHGQPSGPLAADLTLYRHTALSARTSRAGTIRRASVRDVPAHGGHGRGRRTAGRVPAGRGGLRLAPAAAGDGAIPVPDLDTGISLRVSPHRSSESAGPHPAGGGRQACPPVRGQTCPPQPPA